MAILENLELIEACVERSDSGHNVGNIYKGKIKNVLPGMQAVFVDIGREKNAFLYAGDILEGALGKDSILTEGKEILIQIAKDPIGTKGPRATTHLTVPGRYVVLMPTVEHVAVSRRIESETERERLKAIADRLKPQGMGIIVRTVADGKREEDLRKDIEYLHNLWTALSARSKRANSPCLLYRDVDLVIRIVRDYLDSEVEELILDNREAYARVCDLLNYSAPDMVERIHLYEGGEDIFSHYGLEEELANIGQRNVGLACGGYIVIDKTEALTVIDVNTGKFTGSANLEETVFRTNLEAAAEIAKQIRLRDIGGIIIVDFIDMEYEKHRQAVLAALEENLKKDKTKSQVLGYTGLGLVEITRKKSRQNLETILYSTCPCCEGRGRVESPETVVIHILRKLRLIKNRDRRKGGLVLQAHPQVIEALKRQDVLLTRLEKEMACSLRVEAVKGMHPELFSFLYESD
jgi:ribonuclease G